MQQQEQQALVAAIAEQRRAAGQLPEKQSGVNDTAEQLHHC